MRIRKDSDTQISRSRRPAYGITDTFVSQLEDIVYVCVCVCVRLFAR